MFYFLEFEECESDQNGSLQLDRVRTPSSAILNKLAYLHLNEMGFKACTSDYLWNNSYQFPMGSIDEGCFMNRESR